MSLSSEKEPFIKLKDKKVSLMKSFLTSTKTTTKRLKMFAISRFGLIDNEIRKRAWLRMYGINSNCDVGLIDEAAIMSHKDYHQVLMDVNRSLKRFPPGMDEVVRMAMQDQLVNLIVRVLIANKSLHYYQGFHDVCVTFLLVLNEHEAFELLCKLTSTHFIDFMTPTMEATSQLLYLIYAIVELENPTITRTLKESSVEPFFALPWVITWFGHVLGDLQRILRVYDFFLASDPIMPIYLSAAIVLHRQAEVAATERDFAQLHHMLTSLPHSLPIEQLVAEAGALFLRRPPVVIATAGLPPQVNLRLTTIGGDLLRGRRPPPVDLVGREARSSRDLGLRLIGRSIVIVSMGIALIALFVRLIWTDRLTD